MYKLVILFKIQNILNFSLKSREYCFCDAIMTHKLNFPSTYFFSIIFILRTVHLPENNLLKLFCISRLFFLKYSIFWIFYWNPGNIVFAMLSWLINLISSPHFFSMKFILRIVHLPENNLLKLFWGKWTVLSINIMEKKYVEGKLSLWVMIASQKQYSLDFSEKFKIFCILKRITSLYKIILGNSF